MSESDLQPVVESVLRQARLHGYVVPRQVRQELAGAALAPQRWKEVIERARPALHYRQGRYYFLDPAGPQLLQQQSHQQAVYHTLRKLIRSQQAAHGRSERRHQDRIDFIHPVAIQTDDQREFHFLSRDLSPTGMRLLGNRSLLGQRLRVRLAPAQGRRGCAFIVRVLWSRRVGDELFENGSSFVGLADS